MNFTNSETTVAEIDGGEGATGSVAKALKKRRADANLREMLSTLVHEANFLVEDNLNDLVGDIPENERVLFKLDSILTAIGKNSHDINGMRPFSHSLRPTCSTHVGG